MKTKPHIFKLGRNFAALSIGLILMAGVSNVDAAFRTWTGGGNPDFNWSNPANWGGTAPVATTDDLIFSGNVGLQNTNDYAVGTTFRSITITNDAGAFVFQGLTVRLSVGFTNRSSFVQTVQMGVQNNTQVTYNTASNSVIFYQGPWDQRWSKTGPYDVICLQQTNQLNGQLTGLNGGRVILNGFTNGIFGQGLQIDAGGTAVCVGPAPNQIGDNDTRADVTMSGGLFQVQNTNGLGAPTFEQIPMLRSSSLAAVVENGSALGPVQLRVGGGTGARVGAYDGTLRDGSGGGALSLLLNNSSGASYWRLSGTNSYTGDTIITNGFASGFTRLIVNGLHNGGGNYLIQGSVAGGLSVLAGTGTIVANSVNVNSNGVIAPGGVLSGAALYTRQGGGASGSAGVNTGTFAESTGILTITNNVNLNAASSTLDIHLNGTNDGSYDKLVVTGSGVFSNNSANLQLTIDVGFLPASGDKFTIVDVAGTSSANNVGVFATLNGVVTDLSQGATVTLGGSLFKISYRAEGSTFDAGAGNGNNIMLQALQDSSKKLTWLGAGTSSDWDVQLTADWRDTNNAAATFTNLDKVTFNDSGVATNVNLTTDLNPATLMVDTTNNYFFTGSGKLTGAIVITKTNTGTLTVLTANDNVGAAIIHKGTLQIGDGVTDGALNCSVLINSNGVLAINRPTDQDLSGLSGKGVLLHSGAGKLTVTNDQSVFTGTVSNNVGTFQLGNGTAAGNTAKVGGPIVVASGSTLYHNYNGAADVTVANSMSGTGSATFEFSSGSARSIAFGATATNTGFAGTTTVKAFTRLNVAAAAAAPAGPIIVEGSSAPAFGSYYSHPGATVTNFNSITIAGEGPGSSVDTPRGKGALRLGNVWAGPVVLSANATIGSDGTGTIIGNITDNGNNFTLEYLGGTTLVGPTVSTNSYFETRINEDYSGSFTSPTLTTVRALNANPFGYGPVSMKGRARLELNGNNVSIANLNDVTVSTINGTSFAPAVANGSGTTDATLTLGSDNNSSPTFIGTFINGGARSLGLTKVGSGTFTVSGDSTNTGAISVEAGTLALAAASGSYPDSTPVVGSGSFSNAVLLAVSSGATLDVLARTDGTLTLNANQTLKGSGTVSGNVVGGVGSVINPGDSIGSIALSGNVTLLGTVLMELNRAHSPATNDSLVVSGTLTAGGTLTVTNLGPVLQAGNSFQLFNAGVSGFAYNLQTVDVANNVSYTWSNTISVDGKITVASVSPLVNTNSTNIVASVSGGDLTLSWPADHIGWTLQAQTNALAIGLGTNWADVAGSSTTNQVVIPINSANSSVFFRLKY